MGEEHYQTARRVQGILQRYKALQDIIAILGMDELSEEDKLTVARAPPPARSSAFLSQPFDVAEVFTGSPGVQVPVEETVKGFKAICDGVYDHLPEPAFYMVGTIGGGGGGGGRGEEGAETGRRGGVGVTWPPAAPRCRIEDCVNDVCPWSRKAGECQFAHRLSAGAVVGFCNPGCRDKFEAATGAFDSALAARDDDNG